MLITTICYIVQNKKVLMLHRTKKAHDMNEGKWIGVGGKLIEGESPRECIIRETKEETGLDLINFDLRSIVTFDFAKYDQELMFVYVADKVQGQITECNEGDLQWIALEDFDQLNLWDGDRYFLKHIFNHHDIQELKLVYDIDNHLISHE